MTTIDTITAEQIEVLRAEAAEHGDLLRVAICDRALDDSCPDLARQNRIECVRVIRENEAQS